MTNDSPNRLDRMEAMLEGIIRIQGNQQSTFDKIFEGQQRLVDGQLGLQAQMGVLSEAMLETREETKQLKRAVDYLLSKDGGQV